jgi:hypothetical protein
MRTARFQQVAEGAYFLFEPRLFSGSVTAYDARLANQTIISSWGTMQLETEEYRTPEPVDTPPSTQEVPDWPAYPTPALND